MAPRPPEVMNPRGGILAIALRCPHLVLAHVRDDECVVGHLREERVEEANRWLRQSARIDFGAFQATRNAAPVRPIG